ncbi:kinase binding protein CGI-121-domain-containing protein [Kalaharituber pfeilii]|nr:kinase binding protein CGI-121-domain-containing protein [Kalaharituber pfeilii]
MAALHLTTHVLPHLPAASHKVHIAVLKNIKNAEHLRTQLLAGNACFEYAFVDADNIISTKHILVAVFKALRGVLGSSNGTPGTGLRTRNVHSEVVFSLSPNNNITESFTKFGITPNTKNLITIKVEILSGNSGPTTSLPVDVVREFIFRNVEFSESLPFNDETLYRVCDLETIKQRYKFLAIDKGVGVAGKAGKKSSSAQGKKKGTEIIAAPAGLKVDKIEWADGGVKVQQDLETWVLGSMVMRVVG